MSGDTSFDNTSIHIDRVEVHVHLHSHLNVEQEFDAEDEETGDDDDDGDVTIPDDEPETDPGGEVDPIYANGRGKHTASTPAT